MELVAAISNDAPEPDNHAVIRLYLDVRVRIMRLGVAVFNHMLRSNNNDEVPVNVASLNWSSATKMPLWEGEEFLLTDHPIQIGLPPEAGEYILGWRLTAPRMHPN